jgi:hypothetical protein
MNALRLQNLAGHLKLSDSIPGMFEKILSTFCFPQNCPGLGSQVLPRVVQVFFLGVGPSQDSGHREKGLAERHHQNNDARNLDKLWLKESL